MLCGRQTRLLALCSLLCLSNSFVCNSGDKFYRRKSMWETNEKLIINELGSYFRNDFRTTTLKMFYSCTYNSIFSYKQEQGRLAF